MDLIGPLTTYQQGSCYAVTIIDHCTGWLDVYPLPDKTNKRVWDAFSEQFLPRHGLPEICITDNGGGNSSQPHATVKYVFRNAFADVLIPTWHLASGIYYLAGGPPKTSDPTNPEKNPHFPLGVTRVTLLIGQDRRELYISTYYNLWSKSMFFRSVDPVLTIVRSIPLLKPT